MSLGDSAMILVFTWTKNTFMNDILLDRRILGTGKVFFQLNGHHILLRSNPVDILSK